MSTATVAPIRDVASGALTYLAVEDQGLWLLQADGRTIERVAAPVPAITALASDGTTYFIAADEGVFAGAGDHWEQRIAALASAICIQRDRPLYLAGAGRGMWRSDDGVQWSAVPFPPRRVLGCAMSETIAYAGTTDGVYRSTDGGHTWSPAFNGMGTSYVKALALDGETVYAATSGDGLFTSNDHGATWVPISTASRSLEDVAVAAGVISVLTQDALLQSSDGGGTWTAEPISGAFKLEAATLITAATVLP